MTAFILRRLIQSVVVIWVMTLIVFFGVNVIGDPVEMYASDLCNQACRQRIVESLGLDRPIFEQYLVFLGSALKGELGNSFRLGQPSLEAILARLPATIELAIFAMLLTVTIGIPLGMWAGLRPNSIAGRVIMGGSILGFSLPSFWVGLMLILIFAVQFGWLPTTGRGDTREILGVEFSFVTVDGFRHMILPGVNLSLFFTALLIRLVRAGVREVLFVDYVKFAHAKGLRRRRVILVHVLKNIMIPVITVLGLEFGGLLAFAVITETIFAWPGMGKLLIDSIHVLDRPIIVAYLMLIVFFFIVINLLVDITYSVLDPRVRLQGAPS